MFNGEPTADDHGNVLYEIRKDPVVGRYMVASRDIQPGEVIFTDSPVAIGKLGQPISLIWDGYVIIPYDGASFRLRLVA